MPGRFELKPTLAKIWHAPDNFRIMEPLPPMHRRGIIIAAIVLVIGVPAARQRDQRLACRHAGSAIGSAIAITAADGGPASGATGRAAKRSGSGGARCVGTYPGRPAGRTKPAADAAFPAG